MNYVNNKNKFLSEGLFLISTIFLFSLVIGVIGCKKKEEKPEIIIPKVTIENLQTAYQKSLKQKETYELFVKQAEKEHFKNVAKLYHAIARSEEIHAQCHAKLLLEQGVEPIVPAPESVKVGKTLQTLKMAVSIEEIETSSMYPNLIQTAEIEKYPQAIEQFTLIMGADSRHLELLQEALVREGRIEKTQYFVCSQCGYVLTSDKIEECPNCHAKKELFEKI